LVVERQTRARMDKGDIITLLCRDKLDEERQRQRDTKQTKGDKAKDRKTQDTQ